MDEVTIIIKTLDRCDCLINLLDSIFKKYPKKKYYQNLTNTICNITI